MIRIDWSQLARWNYDRARSKNLEFSARYVSNGLIELGKRLKQKMGTFIMSLKFFGHSMGGQLAGRVAEIITEMYPNCKVSLIVAMDPAGYMFIPTETERHCLKPEVALKVIVLHTSLVIVNTPKPNLQLGNHFMLGHEDYFLNGGIVFPGDGNIERRHSHSRPLTIVLDSIARDTTIYGFRSKNISGQKRVEFVTAGEPAIELKLKDELMKKTTVMPKEAAEPHDEPFYVKVSIDRNDESFGVPVPKEQMHLVPLPTYKKTRYVRPHKKHNLVNVFKVVYTIPTTPIPAK